MEHCSEPAEGVESAFLEWRGSGLRAAVCRESTEGVEVALREFPLEFWKFADSFVVATLIDALGNDSWGVRSAAVLALGQIEGYDPEPVVSALIESLRNNGGWGLESTVQALVEIEAKHPEPVVSALTKSLDDGDSTVRQAAALVLGTVKGVDQELIVRALIDVILSADRRERIAAIWALVEIEVAHPEPVVSALTKVLDDDDDDVNVRRAAALALVQIEGVDQELIVRALTYSLQQRLWLKQEAFVQALSQIGDTNPDLVVPTLIDFIQREPNHDLWWSWGGNRETALQALVEIEGADPNLVVPALITALSDFDFNLGIAATRVLVEIEGADPNLVVPVLITALSNDLGMVRSAAALALSQIGDTNPDLVVPELIDAIESNNDSRVRYGAAEALGQIEGADLTLVTPVLIGALSDNNADVLIATARALGNIEDADPNLVVPALIAVQNDNWLVREAVTQALGQIEGADPNLVVPALTKALSDIDAAVALAAAKALIEIEGTDLELVVPALTRALSDVLSAQRGYWNVREAAAQTLGKIIGVDPELIVPALARALSDSVAAVTVAAAQSLGHFEILDWEQIIPVVIELPTSFSEKPPPARELLIRQYVGDLASSNVRTSLVLLNHVHSKIDLRPKLRLWARFLAGENEGGQILVDWLGRATKQPLDGLENDHKRTKETIQAFVDNWVTTEDLMDVRDELVKSIYQVLIQSRNVWEPEDVALLDELRTLLLASDLTIDVEQINQIISNLNPNPNPIANGASIVLFGHAVLWVLLIFVYPYSRPVQAFFFWNKWVRWFIGFGYVPILLAWVPFLRRRMFLPFRTSLLADAQLDSFDADIYYDGSQADSPDDDEQKKLVDALPEICGQIVLEGESGLGKTMFICKLLSESRRIVVYLPATKCVDGVMAAIQSKVQGPMRDPGFLQSLVFAGAIDVIIDGLNEVSARTHARIVEFADTHFSGNLLISTQPMEWTPPPNFKKFEMKPLADAQIMEFLLTRTKSLPEDASVVGNDYENSCRQYIEQALVETEPGSREAVLSALSNPMDLTVIADILARGGQPDLLALRQQQYAVMATDYERRHNGRSFPLERFSERAYEIRESDLEHFDIGEFPDELARMEEHRMIITRPAHDKDGSPVSQFRHDKIMDFFLYHAFMGENRKRQVECLRDARFRGVYLLLATHLPYQKAMALREILIKQAAETKDHSLCDKFVQLLEQRQQDNSPNGANPWNQVAKKYPPSSVHNGVVTRIGFTPKTTNKRAFVELEEGVGGWVYADELGEEDIQNYREGDTARVVVLELDVEEERIVLSVKASGDKKGVGS